MPGKACPTACIKTIPVCLEWKSFFSFIDQDRQCLHVLLPSILEARPNNLRESFIHSLETGLGLPLYQGLHVRTHVARIARVLSSMHIVSTIERRDRPQFCNDDYRVNSELTQTHERQRYGAIKVDWTVHWIGTKLSSTARMEENEQAFEASVVTRTSCLF